MGHQLRIDRNRNNPTYLLVANVDNLSSISTQSSPPARLIGQTRATTLQSMYDKAYT